MEFKLSDLKKIYLGSVPYFVFNCLTYIPDSRWTPLSHKHFTLVHDYAYNKPVSFDRLSEAQDEINDNFTFSSSDVFLTEALSILMTCANESFRPFSMSGRLHYLVSRIWELQTVENSHAFDIGMESVYKDSVTPDIFKAPTVVPGHIMGMCKDILECEDFSLVFVLADMLDDMKFDYPELTSHLRCNRPHYMGCWVIQHLMHATTVEE